MSILMRRLYVLLAILLVLSLGFFAHQTHTEPQVRFNRLIHRLSYPTDLRVRYRIGEVDSRFGLTHEQVKRLAHEAVMIWHDGTGQQWFVYDDTAQVSINLIYDERQIETIARQKIKHNLDELQSRHEQQARHLDKQRQQLAQEYHSLQQTISRWQSEYNALNDTLSRTHDHTQRQQLQQKEQELLAQQRIINDKIKAYASSQHAFNQAVNKINHDVEHLNHAISHANERLTPREFHKGQFDGTKIDIYEFENIDELRLVMAHELGHALSIGHHDDPTALMYPYANEQALHEFKLKPADIELLKNRRLYRW